MKNVLISSELFNPTNKFSKGLISSLKKLSEYSFQIFADKEKIDSTVLDILKLEDIKINLVKSNKDYIEIGIEGKPSDNKIVISKNKIKNIEEAVDKIIKKLRYAEINRKTKETDITIKLELDGEGKAEVDTGIGFFNHMLEQIARHANINLTVKVKGDLDVDEHHTIEDTGIVLGEALKKSLGDKKGIKRFGFMLPMDDSVAECAIDLSGRSYLNFKCKFNREKVGEFPTELTEEFFRGLTIGLKANIYIKAEGKNDHHKIESIFKAFAKALNEACRIDPRAKGLLPSTKGKL